MARYIVGRGTLLNTATVAGGALVGLSVGQFIPPEYEVVALTGIGLFNLGLGVKLFLETRNALIVAAALVLGGVLGVLLHIQPGLEAFADWAKSTFGGAGSSTFQEAVITTFVIFCIGPMTLMGCLQDAIEDRIELLAIKSTMDGIGSIFLAATLGPGVLVTAGLVFVFQGLLTMAASPLRKFAEDDRLVAEANAVGGMMLLAIGLGILGIKKIEAASYLPALAVGPLIVLMFDRFSRRKASGPAQ